MEVNKENADMMPQIVSDFGETFEEPASEEEVELPEPDPKIKVDQNIFMETSEPEPEKEINPNEEYTIEDVKPKQHPVRAGRKKKPPSEKQIAAGKLRAEKMRQKKEEQQKLKLELERLKKENDELKNKPLIVKEIKPPDNTELIAKAVKTALKEQEIVRLQRKKEKTQKIEKDKIFDLVARSKYARPPRKYGGNQGFMH